MKIRSWGVRYNSSIYYAGNYRCECGKFSLLDLGYWNHIVGFDSSVPLPEDSCALDPKIGGLIYRCPSCHELLWNHVLQSVAKQNMRKCDAWPQTEPLEQ